MRAPRVRTSLAAALLVLLASACGNEGAAEPGASTPSVPAPTRSPGPPPAALVPGDPLAGSWWASCPERPHLGLRLDFQPTVVSGVWDGTAICFDWRGTTDAGQMFRASRPVKVQAQTTADEPLTAVISGPIPMLTADGRPNGLNGRWTLRVVEVDAPVNERTLAGTLDLSGRDAGTDLPAALRRPFRTWAP